MTSTKPLRRQFLAAGAGSIAAAAVPAGLVQAQFDAACDQGHYAPNQPLVTRRHAINSAAARERLGAPQRFGYGLTAIESVDVYPVRQANAPVMVFIHGATAWRATTRSRPNCSSRRACTW